MLFRMVLSLICLYTDFRTPKPLDEVVVLPDSVKFPIHGRKTPSGDPDKTSPKNMI